VRVVDGASRQWPFVLIADAGHDTLALRVDPGRAEAGHSRFRLVPPVDPMVLDGVTLRIDRERFDRRYRLLGEMSGGRAPVLATGRLVRAPAEPAAIEIAFPRTRVAELALVVDDGDEAPLPLAGAQGRVPVAELRLLAPAGAYTLLAGDLET